MKKLFPIMFVLAACAVDINEDPAPANAIIANFDPSAATPVVPLPTDLAINATTGKIVVPPTVDPATGKVTDSAAQTEFNEQYLGTLSGFPYESTASTTVSGELNAASVNPMTVIALDITAAPTKVDVTPTYANKTITVAPPKGNWLRAHHYAILVVGGANGVRGAANEDVIGSLIWELVSSRNSLVACDGDMRTIAVPANGATPATTVTTNCHAAVDIIPGNFPGNPLETDAQRSYDAQTVTALQLEAVRKGYAPIFDALAPPVPAGFGLDRKDIPILWTFTITDAGEMTFDPANTVLPFPNDAARTGPTTCGPDNKQGCVALPSPVTGKPPTPAECGAADAPSSVLLICGINSLDGFSMQAPLISENSDAEGAIQGFALNKDNLIDPKSLTPASVGLAKLVPGAPTALQTDARWTPCLNCMSSTNDKGVPQTSPQQLQWRLDVPLDEHTTYAGYVTNAVKDTAGKPVIANPVFALTRLSNTLLDNSACPAPVAPATVQAPCAMSKSTVSLISDDQARQLEPLRASYKPVFDALDKAGVHRTDLALAFPFTTQSASKFLDAIYGAPAQLKLLGLKDVPGFVVDATAPTTAAVTAAGIPHANIAKFFAGEWPTPVLVTGPGGTLNPSKPKLLPVHFIMAVPTGTPPAGGWPVTIFGHGITRWRNDMLALANSVATAGQVIIATDVVFHGDRTTCTGSKASTGAASDDASCADPTTMKCDGDQYNGLCILSDAAAARMACPNGLTDPNPDLVCLGAGQGLCAADHKCQGAGADFKRASAGSPPDISGWNEFSLTNFFATRDNFRQQVADLSQLVNILRSGSPGNFKALLTAANGATEVPLNTTSFNYVGQSLGGILGELFTSSSPDVGNVVLNVPGGALVQIILNAPSFASAKAALVSTLAASKIFPGTPAFDQFLGIAQWVLDEADPAVLGYRLTHPVDIGAGVTAPPANRKAFIQFIEGDQTVPNISNFALVNGANRTFDPSMPPNLGCKPPLYCYEFTEKGDGFDAASVPPAHRHGFLLAPPSDGTPSPQALQLTVKAQTQAATFLATGVLQ